MVVILKKNSKKKGAEIVYQHLLYWLYGSFF